MGDDRIADEPTTVIITDASVLIDYYTADARILSRISRCIGSLVIPRQVFEEVRQIEEAQAKILGISILDPELSQFTEASIRGGPLSRADKLILIMARDRGYPCWTNDSRLRKKCLEEGIQVFWGLEIMLPLCKGGQLLEKAALRIGRRIHECNRFYITDEIIMRFEKRVRSLFK